MTKKNEHRRLCFADMEGDLATPVEFAMLTDMHENTVRAMCKDGRLQSTKIGTKYAIPWRIVLGLEKEAEVA